MCVKIWIQLLDQAYHFVLESAITELLKQLIYDQAVTDNLARDTDAFAGRFSNAVCP